MDRSVIVKELHCLYYWLRFLGCELTCSEFTNSKALVLSLIGMSTTHYVLDYNMLTIIPRCVMSGTFWISTITAVFEGFGVMIRLLDYHMLLQGMKCPCTNPNFIASCSLHVHNE